MSVLRIALKENCLKRWVSEIGYLCRKWSGVPNCSDGEMDELRFYDPKEIDLEQISPPIKNVVADYINKFGK